MDKNMFGIDMGTYEIKIYESASDEVLDHKNAIAIQRIGNKKHIFATGDDAWEMYEKCPRDITVVYPMEGGVISDFDAMQYLLQSLVWGDRKNKLHGAGYLLAVPTDITDVEKKAFFDLIVQSDARTRDVRLVPIAVADAIGMGLDVYSKEPCFIVNIGGATTEYSIIASGGLVINKIDKFGGKKLDNAIMSAIRKEYSFLIGVFAAEELKNEMGYAYGIEEEASLVPGRSLVSGLPGEIEINSHEVYTAIKPGIMDIIDGCLSFMERIPPEMTRYVKENGLYLTGGTALLKNLNKLFERELGIPVQIAERPQHTTVDGLRKIILSGKYDDLTYSMLDNRNRWIR